MTTSETEIERDPIVSVVIPARNEGSVIASTIRGAHLGLQDGPAYEIIVVDNDSTDRTVDVASSLDTRVISNQSGSIGSSRNRGAKVARGSVLVFLDADMIVDQNFAQVIDRNREDLLSLRVGQLGGVFRAPAGAGWVPRTWFDPARESEGRSHIASGLMMMSHVLFDRLGGFDERLPSGEDYDLSRRVVDSGFKLATDPEWTAIHAGGPNTVIEFFRREIWHGQKASGMSQFGNVEKATLVFVLAHAVLVAPLLSGDTGLVALAAMGAAGCLGVPWYAARRRFGRVSLKSSALFYIYFWARAVALTRRFVGRPHTVRAMGR